MSRVLVTGGSGFVGSHVIGQVLTAEHQVRTTVQSLARQAGVRAVLKQAGRRSGFRFISHRGSNCPIGWFASPPSAIRR